MSITVDVDRYKQLELVIEFLKTKGYHEDIVHDWLDSIIDYRDFMEDKDIESLKYILDWVKNQKRVAKC